jgi:hypothetical protein
MAIRSNTEQMIRAGLALQVAALEFNSDESGTQFEARQAIIAMRESINSAQNALALMQRAVEDRRRIAANKGA